MASINIDLLDVVGSVREEPPGALESLMAAIAKEGILHRITVMPNPEAEGRYIVVSGRRRLAAARRLNWGRITAQIKPYNALMAEMIEISENFHRLDLTTAQKEHAILRYAELVRSYEAEAKPVNGEVEDKPPLRAYKQREPAVIKTVAKDLGIGERTAQRVLQRAEVFTPEQRQTLEVLGTGRIDRVAAIREPETRDLVIESIKEGVSFPNAMAGAMGEDYTPGEEELSDKDWLATLDLSSAKVDQKRFRADALFYRRVQQARIVFMADVGWEKLKERADQGAGIYFRRMKFFLECNHPRDWVKCAGCTAGIANGREHPNCHGGGYLLG